MLNLKDAIAAIEPNWAFASSPYLMACDHIRNVASLSRLCGRGEIETRAMLRDHWKTPKLWLEIDVQLERSYHPERRN